VTGLKDAVQYDCDFGALMREHRAMVFSIGYHFLRDRELADEVAQEVFLSLHQNLRTIESAAHAAAWLRRVAVQRAIDAARKRGRSRQVAIDELQPELSIWPMGRDPMLSEMLRRLVAALPETPRMAMVLRYQEDLDPAEISAAMGIPVATVKSHLQRSLALLREKLERRGVCGR
jgi:RNA polymerase sigma-70 factor, ECF subfamily